MAAKMNTSRGGPSTDYLIHKNTAVTLKTLGQATPALGKRLWIIIEDQVRH